MPGHYGRNTGRRGRPARRRSRRMRSQYGSPPRMGSRGMGGARRPRHTMNSRVANIPDLPPEAARFRNVVRTGAENNKNVDLMLCPQDYISSDCVKLTPTQIKFYNGEGPY